MFSLTCYYCESATGEVVTVRSFISPATRGQDRAVPAQASCPGSYLLQGWVCLARPLSPDKRAPLCPISQAEQTGAELSPDQAREGQTDHCEPGRHLTTPRPVLLLPIHNGLLGLFRTKREYHLPAFHIIRQSSLFVREKIQLLFHKSINI